MPKDQLTDQIKTMLSASEDALSALDIQAQLTQQVPLRTLQYQLKKLVGQQQIIQEGKTRATRYRMPPPGTPHRYGTIRSSSAERFQVGEPDDFLGLSAEAERVQRYVRQPLSKRKVVGYNFDFLNRYRPNVSAYLTEQERQHLHQIGTPKIAPQPAGTYARHILNRLLIDLSWNSSRLEGNTYSLLDSRRLIDFGQIAEGRKPLEAQMILNHKDAIEFLVGNAEDIGFNRYTVLNLHAMLANGLFANPAAVGSLRSIAVGISQSAFLPLEEPQLISEYFDQILQTAKAITDPFEQSLFLMVQLPYLQPFEDVNKRVSRLAANVPLIRKNLCPLSFMGMPGNSYLEAVMGVYELNDTSLLKAVFIQAYERSAESYAAVRQSIGEPDPLRLRYREALKTIVSIVINGGMGRQTAFEKVSDWCQREIAAADREAFQIMVEDELLSLHEGNFARYSVRPSMFLSWQAVWSEGALAADDREEWSEEW